MYEIGKMAGEITSLDDIVNSLQESFVVFLIDKYLYERPADVKRIAGMISACYRTVIGKSESVKIPNFENDYLKVFIQQFETW